MKILCLKRREKPGWRFTVNQKTGKACLGSHLGGFLIRSDVTSLFLSHSWNLCKFAVKALDARLHSYHLHIASSWGQRKLCHGQVWPKVHVFLKTLLMNLQLGLHQTFLCFDALCPLARLPPLKPVCWPQTVSLTPLRDIYSLIQPQSHVRLAPRHQAWQWRPIRPNGMPLYGSRGRLPRCLAPTQHIGSLILVRLDLH